MTLLAQQTIAYKTYIKETLVKALRTVFNDHPDPMLAKTKVTIDYSFTELDYPAIVVRFYERSIKNAGVGHFEWLQAPEQIGNIETWFDDFQNIRGELDYISIFGSYPEDGAITDQSYGLIPYVPDEQGDAGSQVQFEWIDGEDITVRSVIRTLYEPDSAGIYGEVEFTPSDMVVRLKFKSSDGPTNVLSQTSVALPDTDNVYWLTTEIIGDVVEVRVLDADPLLASSTPVASTSATMAEEDLTDITGHGRIGIEANGVNGGASYLKKFRTMKLNSVLPSRYIRYKHYLYSGDIEFAIYALSSYDRDLIADSLVQTLAMADTEAYTDSFLQRIYEADPSSDPESANHFINLNTDEIQGFGESQVPAPWQPEDVLVYQTSYRIAIHGEFYSRTPNQGDYGLVEAIETYPYLSPIEEKPNPNPEDPAAWS